MAGVAAGILAWDSDQGNEPVGEAHFHQKQERLLFSAYVFFHIQGGYGT